MRPAGRALGMGAGTGHIARGQRGRAQVLPRQAAIAGDDVASLVAADGFEPDLVLSIARGGLFLGGALGPGNFRFHTVDQLFQRSGPLGQFLSLLPLGTENGNVSFLVPYAAISYEDYQERTELRK